MSKLEYTEFMRNTYLDPYDVLSDCDNDDFSDDVPDDEDFLEDCDNNNELEDVSDNDNAMNYEGTN